MKKRNLYKDAVLCFLAGVLAVGVFHVVKQAQNERKIYGFLAEAQADWTEKDVAELKKLRGIQKFLPVTSVSAVVKLDGYTLETEIKGISLEEYPLKWQKAGETYELGNRAVLFMGKDCFTAFMDDGGNAPGQGEIQAWTENCQELAVTLTDEKGRVHKAIIRGILKSPAGAVCMEQSQMKEIWGRGVQVKEGYVEIYGQSNMERAKEALENGGISCAAGD